MSEEEHDQIADKHEREADDLERQSEKLEERIKETRDDWNAKKRDESLPGAKPDEEDG